MYTLVKKGLVSLLVGLSITSAASAAEPAAQEGILVAQMMDVKPSDPMFDAMLLEELTKLNMQLQMLSVQAMESNNEDVKKLAMEMFDSAMKMEDTLGAPWKQKRIPSADPWLSTVDDFSSSIPRGAAFALS